jgi:endonuclease YncB( thermonuclease family)
MSLTVQLQGRSSIVYDETGVDIAKSLLENGLIRIAESEDAIAADPLEISDGFEVEGKSAVFGRSILFKDYREAEERAKTAKIGIWEEK